MYNYFPWILLLKETTKVYFSVIIFLLFVFCNKTVKKKKKTELVHCFKNKIKIESEMERQIKP